MRAAALAALALVACQGTHAGSPRPNAPTPPDVITDQQLLATVVGDWRWLHVSRDDQTLVIERERWHFGPITDDDAPITTGQYRRDVAVIALDGKPFLCDQQPSYLQTAVFDVRASIRDRAIAIEELGYHTVDSPCEPGIRELGRYTATPVAPARALALTWDGGDQTLEPDTDPSPIALPAVPADTVTGAWHWSVRTRDPEGYARAEDEAWELAVAADGTLGGTYVRTVTTYTEDGSTIPCAGSSQWRYIDRYTLRGRVDRESGTFRIEEAAVDPGTHPCIATTPSRHLDAATGIAVGDFLELTWRGKRRQILHR